jgi:hypothetical protein
MTNFASCLLFHLLFMFGIIRLCFLLLLMTTKMIMYI